jgi:CheY-like chemotaxis protein
MSRDMKVKNPVVLIVDDDENDQMLIETAFRKVGVTCPVLAVGDGEQAIAYLKGQRQYADRKKFPHPTFLTVDLKMPKVNGFELLGFLKKNPNLQVIPTIVFTSSSDTNDVTNAFLLGANAYHVKPQTFKEMCDQLKIMHDYWITCETPELDASGNLVPTHGRGKLSEDTLKNVRGDDERDCGNGS